MGHTLLPRAESGIFWEEKKGCCGWRGEVLLGRCGYIRGHGDRNLAILEIKLG